MDAIGIKERIIANVGNLIGTYTHEQFTIPSIWIGVPPQDFLCKGLEIIVSEYPETSIPGNRIVNEIWKIVLTQFEGSDNISQATNILRTTFRPNRVAFLQQPKNFDFSDLKVLPQAIISYECKQFLT